MQKSTMPNLIECLANIAENNSKFLSVIQSLSDIISNIHQLVDSWIAFGKDFELFSAMLARHSIKFGIVDFCINWKIMGLVEILSFG
jgi:hypothetical protein